MLEFDVPTVVSLQFAVICKPRSKACPDNLFV